MKALNVVHAGQVESEGSLVCRDPFENSTGQKVHAMRRKAHFEVVW